MSVVQRGKKERNACVWVQIWKHKRSQRETVEQEIERVVCTSSSACVHRCMLAHGVNGVNVLGNSLAFNCSRSVSILPRCSPLNTPQASDMVATSGFTRLPLCFTRVQWTAEFHNCELAIVPNQLAKRCLPYRLFLVLSKGLNFFIFYSLLVTYG